RYVLAFQAGKVAVGRHFSVDLASCAKAGHALPESIKVQARMPEHRHGMNYLPKVARVAPGRWRAEGLMFHMPGKWEFVFELRGAGSTDVLTSAYRLSQAPEFSDEEKRRILSHGPWPPRLARDPSNRVS